MEQVMHAIVQFAAVASGSLVSAVVGGVLLAGAVGLCLRLVPGITAAARFVVWMAALLMVVPLHFVPMLRGGSSAGAAGSGNLLHVDARWALAIAGVWIGLSVWRAGQFVAGALRLRGIAKRAVVADVEFDRSLLTSGGRAAELCVSEDVDRPSVAGFFSPRILLPAGLVERISAKELEQIVRHEMEHLRRRDDWTNLLQKLSLVMFPLNPAMSWVERQMCVERELACDDCVLAATKARKDYAVCLTNLAEHTLVRRGASLALGAWEKQSELSQRVHRILSRPEAVLGRRQARAVTGVLITGMMGGAVMLAGSPQLISFSPAIGQVQMSAESVNSTSGFKARPVSLRSSSAKASSMRRVSNPGGAAPMLVKAVMPERSKAEAQSQAQPRSHNAPAKLVKHRAPVTHRAAMPGSMAVLKTWEGRELMMQPRVVQTRSVVAVVPAGDGWLVIQL
jgi:beta-lactamase regulating signal transducer with metallopeptidase domain